MATTPYFVWPAQASSAAASDLMAGFGFSAQEDTAALAATTGPMDMAPLHAPELSEAVARPRLRRQASSGSGRQQGAAGSGGGGTPKKPPQRGLGVAELERLRCGGVDPLQDLNVAAAAAMLEAAAASAQGNPVLLHHHQDHLPAFDAATGARYYSPLLVQQPPPPARYVHGMAPEQQYFMDRWGRVGGFFPAGNAGAVGGHLQQLQAQAQAPAPEQPSSQNTIWRPAPSSASSCLHAGHRCDLCSKTVRAIPERPPRAPAPAPAAATTTTMPDHSIYDLAAAMTAARKVHASTHVCKARLLLRCSHLGLLNQMYLTLQSFDRRMQETAGDGYLAREAKKEVREIEFFPTSAADRANESEFATAMRRTTPFPSATPSVGGYGAPLDLSLRL
ncbi:hypothetical protein ACQ4PT_060489 [Festuca glaucescens]